MHSEKTAQTDVEGDRHWQRLSLLIVGFCLSLLIRVVVGGHMVASSALAGLVFAACLTALSWKTWRRQDVSLAVYGWGLIGAVILFVPIGLFHLPSIVEHARPSGNYLAWGLVVSVVAAAEELFLRGALYNTLRDWRGEAVAILVGAVAFAGLHVPLYGWHVVPLDFAVGLLLGSLRRASGSWVAPATTHVLADLGAWWLV